MHLVLLRMWCKIPQSVFNLVSLFHPPCSGLDVLLEFLNAEVTVVVQFGERLPNPQGCEAGRRALVPTLLHDLHNGREDLGTHRQMQNMSWLSQQSVICVHIVLIQALYMTFIRCFRELCVYLYVSLY